MSLPDAWLTRGLQAWSLRPLAAVYGVLAGLHRGMYALGLRQAQRLPVPVIVVGNVVAGGAGKTPVVAAIVEHLKARGLRPGVIARGYGRRTRDCREVTPDADPADTGDEPLLLARRCRVPVFVAPRRVAAGRALLAAHPGVQLLVCDDGLQHHALARDVEVCVFDDRGTGNGWLLPAGPLREPWPRSVDLVLRPRGLSQIDGFTVERRLAPLAEQADGTRCRLADLGAATARPVLAVAGIARPQAFFAMLDVSGLRPARLLALADHHDYDAHPVRVPDGFDLVCTEKDAVKLWRQHPQAWAVPLAVAIEPSFWRALDARIDAQVGPALSSIHGSQTA